jgi:hypothetical protein
VLLVLDGWRDWKGGLLVGVFTPGLYPDPEELWEPIVDREPVGTIDVRIDEKVVDVRRVRESGSVKLVVLLIAFSPAGKGNPLDPEDENGVPDDEDRRVPLVVTVGVIGDMLVGAWKPDRAPPGKVRRELKVDNTRRFGGRWCGIGGVIEGDEEELDDEDDVEAVDVND